jgi:hypothetical protein
MTRPGHWEAWIGIVRRPLRRLALMPVSLVKVRDDEGHSVERAPCAWKIVGLIDELMEVVCAEGVWGAEKLWTARNFPGLPGFGMMESGDDWKGPMSFSISCWEQGQDTAPCRIPSVQCHYMRQTIR